MPGENYLLIHAEGAAEDVQRWGSVRHKHIPGSAQFVIGAITVQPAGSF